MPWCIADVSPCVGMRPLLPRWRVTPAALRGGGRRSRRAEETPASEFSDLHSEYPFAFRPRGFGVEASSMSSGSLTRRPAHAAAPARGLVRDPFASTRATIEKSQHDIQQFVYTQDEPAKANARPLFLEPVK
jgi:hypothetical protein